MKLILSIVFIVIINSQKVLAQETSMDSVVQTVNQVLYSSSKQTWTLRDFKLYKAILKKYFSIERVSDFAESDQEDFLISRLAYVESQTFGIKNDTSLPAFDGTKKLDTELSEFNTKEILAEIRLIHDAYEFLNLKKSQVIEKDRLRAWFEVLKRKNSIRKKF